MTRYWVVRTFRGEKDFLWEELKAGRLRQGWGYDLSQDLRTIRAALDRGESLSTAQTASWRGNRRLLEEEHGSIQEDDLVIVPHLPRYGEWAIVRVTGGYDYRIDVKQTDFGHIRPVELLTVDRSVNPYEAAVSARLRQTMRNRLRLWNIDRLGAEVDELVEAIEAKVPGDTLVARLPNLLSELEDAAWPAVQRLYHGQEFERPCVELLRAIYGEDNVEHTAGRNERGADAICTHIDPLGVQHRVAVQIKMWEWEADDRRPLEQIREAKEHHEGITAGVIFSTSKGVSDSFEKAREELEKELGIPVRILLRQELLHLFIANLPGIVSGSEPM